MSVSLRSAGLVLITAIALAAAGSASAAERCDITTVTGVAFGIYNVDSAAPLDSNGAILLDCNGVPRNVIVDLSRGNAPSYSPRFLLRGVEQLSYNLYLDAARTTIWGDGTGGTSHYGPFNPPNVISLPIYGRIPAGQDKAIGTYTDTIVITVNF